MKIRKKLSLVIVGAFIINNLLLLAYYELFLSQGVSKELNDLQGKLDNTLVEICDKLSDEPNSNISDVNQVINSVDEFKDEESYFVELKDINGNVLINKGINNKGAVRITSSSMIVIKDSVYQLKLIQNLPIDAVKQIPVLKEIIRVEIVIITFILIMLMAIIYIKMIKPILELQRDMENYKYGIKPPRNNKKDEIWWLKNKFAELAEQLEEEKENQNRIIASISHDIKTPLTSIMGYAERLNNKKLPEERQKKYIEIMHKKSQDINELIEEFDDYLSYNLETTMKMKKIKVEALINLIKEEYEDELSQLNIDFKIKSNTVDSYIEIDLSKIRRVFGNIIGNSIKNMNSENKSIEVDAIDLNNEILISIKDNGTGVDEKELDKIFEALYTSDKSRKVAGLGLSICKSAILGHKGKIWAENSDEGGLIIKLTIPKLKNSIVKLNV
ncbi:MAG: sensor histidine kinase [Peptostreptococcaceae bacterium]